jgi:isopenicillin N synthase-like dioxygenase
MKLGQTILVYCCRDALDEFTKECGGVKDGLLRAMAKLLELDDDDYFIDQLGDRASTHARCSYYPECPRPELVFGLKPHCDGTVVTVLMVDDTVGGLQVLRDGVWWDVPVVPHALLVIIGDQTQVRSYIFSSGNNLLFRKKTLANELLTTVSKLFA